MNAVDAQAQQGGILPAAAAALPVGSLLEITYRDGSTTEGVIADTQGATWVQCRDGATILLSSPWGPVDLSVIHAARTLKSAEQIAAERAARKFGEEAYPPPTTRDGHEETLYDLAADMGDLARETHQGGFALETIRRKMQLEAQFDRLADSIALAKTKRRYIRATATRRRAGEPMPRPAQIAGGPMEEALYSVPKPQDFDPDPATRNRRWPRPALDYNTRAEVQSSLDAALQKLAKKRVSPKKRKQMERIAATRKRQLERGEYFEAVSAAAILPPRPTATDAATAPAAPIQTTTTATAARPLQMELF